MQRDPRQNNLLTLQEHARAVKALEEAHVLHRYPWRDWTKYDLSACPHTEMQMVRVENVYGAWLVEVCVNCGSFVSRHCECTRSSWNPEGSVLTCDNCGKDGT